MSKRIIFTFFITLTLALLFNCAAEPPHPAGPALPGTLMGGPVSTTVTPITIAGNTGVVTINCRVRGPAATGADLVFSYSNDGGTTWFMLDEFIAGSESSGTIGTGGQITTVDASVMGAPFTIRWNTEAQGIGVAAAESVIVQVDNSSTMLATRSVSVNIINLPPPPPPPPTFTSLIASSGTIRIEYASGIGNPCEMVEAEGIDVITVQEVMNVLSMTTGALNAGVIPAGHIAGLEALTTDVCMGVLDKMTDSTVKRFLKKHGAYILPVPARWTVQTLYQRMSTGTTFPVWTALPFQSQGWTNQNPTVASVHLLFRKPLYAGMSAAEQFAKVQELSDVIGIPFTISGILPQMIGTVAHPDAANFREKRRAWVQTGASTYEWMTIQRLPNLGGRINLQLDNNTLMRGITVSWKLNL